jgi:hypothetical protein
VGCSQLILRAFGALIIIQRCWGDSLGSKTRAFFARQGEKTAKRR